MTWRKLPEWTGIIYQGCLHAPGVERIASLETQIAVGFGLAQITKDEEVIYEEDITSDEGWDAPPLSKFETMAQADPDHDWRMTLIAPLRGVVYQRHAENEWVLIESNMGFA